MRTTDTIKNALRTATTIRPVHYADGDAVQGYASGGAAPDDDPSFVAGGVVKLDTGRVMRDVAHPHSVMERGDWRAVSHARDTGEGLHHVELPIRALYATQNHVNEDFKDVPAKNAEKPFVIRKAGRYFMQDGHHRVMAAAADGKQTVPVRLVNLDGDTQTDFPLLDRLDAKLPKARGGSVNHAPSEAQKAAGNYRKKHVNFQGLNIAIENEKGSIRRGKSASGHAWQCRLPTDYGYIKGTVGADKDHVDCYVGPDEDSHVVFVVNQVDPGTKKFDEHKICLGFKTEEDAICCYLGAFSDGSGPRRIGSIETMSLDGFKKWLHRGNTTKLVAPGSIINRAMHLIAVKGAH